VRPRGLIAVRPGGEGDVGASNIAWIEARNAPEVPSPLLYHGRLYTVTIGGILTCLDPRDGRVIYRGRLGKAGEYYASPVAAAGRVYFASRDGAVTAIAEGDELKVLARNELGEEIFASPAILGDTLYVRTAAHVYAFREAEKAR
jgi:outer membrane protein assembly factor BamB